MAEAADTLSIWTLYDSPRDAPGMFVLRRFEIHRGDARPTPDAHYSRQAEPLRELMRERGLFRLPRDARDHESVVESWL